jgi:uncharacterized membrane protein
MTPPSFASRPDRRDDPDDKVIPGSTVTDPTPDTAVPPKLQDDKALPIAIYALHIAGAVTGGFTSLIAAILAYISRRDAADWLASHYEFQIRTFWLALLFSAVSLLLTPVGVGVVMLVAVGLWVIVRAVVGLSHLLKGQPYPTPKNWML